jgi:enterochelin esterase-like enzyme
MFRRLIPIFLIITFTLIACDPMAPQPVVIVVTAAPTLTPTQEATSTPIITRTPIPTETPDFTPTPTPFPCEEDGSLIELEMTSIIAREDLAYNVYIPPCYQASLRRFPVLYLIHGLRERQIQWDNLGILNALNQGIRLGVLPPMIVVMPYYGVIGTNNTFPPDASYETVVLDELLPRVETDFCTINQRDFRAIGGISRGGFWAFTIALRHPDIFGIIGGHSAFFPDDLTEVPAAFSPLDLARNSTLLPEANLRMYLDNAARDDAGLGQQVFSDRLTARSIPHTYIINTLGDHSNNYWSAHLGEYLEFYGRTWTKNYSSLPGCLEPSP